MTIRARLGDEHVYSLYVKRIQSWGDFLLERLGFVLFFVVLAGGWIIAGEVADHRQTQVQLCQTTRVAATTFVVDDPAYNSNKNIC